MILNKKNYFNRLLKKLATLQFAITLLFIIAALIAVGTVIEQDQPLSFYKESYPDINPLFGFFTWRWITALGIDHLYTSFCFILVSALFLASILGCTFTTQLPSFKKFRLWEFISNSQQLERQSMRAKNKRNFANVAAYRAYGDNYHLFRQGRRNYAYAGLLGRVGPIIVHFSITALFFGASWSALSGYNIQEIVPRGELLHLQNLVKSGPISRVSDAVVLRVNDFWITYTSESKINQFYSDISLLDKNGSEHLRKTIFVNEPLQTNGLTIYQTDWDLIGLKISLNGSKDIQIPLQKIIKSGRKFWLGSTKVGPDGDQKLTILCNDLKGDIYLYDKQGVLINKLRIGEIANLDSFNSIIFRNFITSTGLQIKEDPGLIAVYLSFFFLIISIYVSFFSYSQLWGIEEFHTFLIAGKSNRAILDFQEQFKRNFTLLN